MTYSFHNIKRTTVRQPGTDDVLCSCKLLVLVLVLFKGLLKGLLDFSAIVVLAVAVIIDTDSKKSR